jgi:hypothetical protein
MNEQRKGGIALIASSACWLVTMALHPFPHDLHDPRMQLLGVVVHALAIFAVPLAGLGAVALTRQTGSTLALAFHAFALVCGMLAATMSGLLVTWLASLGAPADSMRLAGLLNQAFSMVYAAGSSIALVLWSVAAWRGRSLPRALCIYGAALGALTAVLVVSGSLRLDVHGFGAVVLSQAVFFVAAAVRLL